MEVELKDRVSRSGDMEVGLNFDEFNFQTTAF